MTIKQDAAEGTITIPTVEELKNTLAGLERLLIAKNWERAAIVWAFTRDDDAGGRPPNDDEAEETEVKTTQFPTSFREFARLGFAGLTEYHTVARYWHAWDDAIKQRKARPVHPGDSVKLPKLPWPPSPRTEARGKQEDAAGLKAAAAEAGIKSTTVLDIASNKEALKAAIKGSPKVREAAHAAIAEEATARYEKENRDPEGKRIAALAKDVGVNVEDIVRVRENPKVMEAVILSDHQMRQTASDAIGRSVREQYPDLKFRPEAPDDIQFGALFEARSALERAVKGAQEARRKLRDVPMDDANKGVIVGLIKRLAEVTEDLRAFVEHDDVFETGVRRVLEEGKGK